MVELPAPVAAFRGGFALDDTRNRNVELACTANATVDTPAPMGSYVDLRVTDEM